MSGTPQPANQPIDDLRLIQQQVAHDRDAISLQIAADAAIRKADLEKIEETKSHVDGRSHIFNTGLGIGLLAMLVVLFLFLATTLQPIVNVVAEKAAEKAMERFDLDEKVEETVEAELKLRIKDDLLLKDEVIEATVAETVQSPDFKEFIRETAEAAARKSVTTSVNELIANTDNFRAIRDEQIRAEQDRLKAATGNITIVTGTDRESLQKSLLAVISSTEKLGLESAQIKIAPFGDSLQLTAYVRWNPGDAPKPVQIPYFRVAGLGATTSERKEKVEAYLGQPSLPSNATTLQRSPEGADKKFIAGNTYADDEFKFSDYQSMANELSKSSVDFVDDCFGIEYPVTWHVEITQ